MPRFAIIGIMILAVAAILLDRTGMLGLISLGLVILSVLVGALLRT